jgi:hypothetical protein
VSRCRLRGSNPSGPANLLVRLLHRRRWPKTEKSTKETNQAEAKLFPLDHVRVNGYPILGETSRVATGGVRFRRPGRKSHIIADPSNFSPWPMPQGDNSRRGPVFDVEFAQNVFDVLADRPGACAEDHADLMIRFTLCDPSQNLRFARGETQ